MHKENSTYIFDLIREGANFFQFKLFALLIPVYTFLFGDIETKVALGLVVLIVFDFFTGLAAAKKCGHEIKSAKVFRSAIKLVVYFMFVAAGHLVEVTNPIVLGFVDDTIMGFLAITELISIIENIGNIGFAIPKKLLNKLQSFNDTK